MIYKVVYLFLYLQIVHKRHFWFFTKLRFIVLICSDLADAAFQVYFEDYPDYLTGTVRLNLHIYGRPSTILILTCLFQTSPVPGHTFWLRNRTRTVIQQCLGFFRPLTCFHHHKIKPVMGKEVAIRQAMKYNILEKVPNISPVCKGLMEAANCSLRGLSRNNSRARTAPSVRESSS